MKLHKWIHFWLASLLFAGLSGCGNGGLSRLGDGPASDPAPATPATPASLFSAPQTTPSTLQFNLANAMSAYLQATHNYTVSGSGSYSAMVNLTPISSPASGVLGQPATAFKTIAETITISNGASGVIATEAKDLYIYNAGALNGTMLGSVDLGTGYSTVASNQTPFPPTPVNVGSSGQLMTGTIYTNSTPPAVYATFVDTWSLLSDTATTAWLCISDIETLTGSTSPIPDTNCLEIDTSGNILKLMLDISVPSYSGGTTSTYSTNGQMTFQ